MTAPEVQVAGARLRELLALYREKEDLIAIGAYTPGSDVRIDRAIELLPSIDAFLRQPVSEHVPAEEADAALVGLTAEPQAYTST